MTLWRIKRLEPDRSEGIDLSETKLRPFPLCFLRRNTADGGEKTRPAEHGQGQPEGQVLAPVPSPDTQRGLPLGGVSFDGPSGDAFRGRGICDESAF